MNIQEYIESGVLELYATGALSSQEMRDVEAVVAEYPEVQTELNAIQDALNNYATQYKRNPRPELRAAILDALEEPKQATVYSLNGHGSSRPNGMKYFAVAASVLFVISTSAAAYFWYQWQNAKQTLLAVQSDRSQFAQDYQKVRSTLDRTMDAVGIMKDRSFRTVEMKGMPVTPHSLAVVYWKANSAQVYLDAGNLPTPPSGKQYQLWAIAAGKPVDAGVFDMDTNGIALLQMKAIPEAEAFAVTLEPKGGSVSPTMDAMYVFGKI